MKKALSQAKILAIDRNKGRVTLAMKNGLISTGTYLYDLNDLRVGMIVLIGKVSGTYVIMNKVAANPKTSNGMSILKVLTPPPPILVPIPQIMIFVGGYSIGAVNIGNNIIEGHEALTGTVNGSIVIVAHNPFITQTSIICTITNMSVKRVGEEQELVGNWYNNYPGNNPSSEHWPVFLTTGPNYLHVEDTISPFALRIATNSRLSLSVGQLLNISFTASIT
jgi:hypothetical protein